MQNEKLIWRGKKVDSWAEFHRRVKPRVKLLGCLERFPEPVLVAGCQRSGTTAAARLLSRAEGVGDYRFGKDDELAAALLLSGHVEMPTSGRACFQTTYINDRVAEYFEHEHFRLLWLLRDPKAVVYSMLFNWPRGALRRLYAACGQEREAPDAIAGRAESASGADPTAFERRQKTRPAEFATRVFRSRLDKACAAYTGKTRQTFELMRRLGKDRIMVVDYNDLVTHKADLIPAIFRFAGLPFREELLDGLHARALDRARWRPSQSERIERLCRPIYERARAAALEFQEAQGSSIA